MPKLDGLLKNLEDEEVWMRQDAVAIAQKPKKFDPSANSSEAERKNYRMRKARCKHLQRNRTDLTRV